MKSIVGFSAKSIAMSQDELTIEVICTELPGKSFCDGERSRTPVYLGIQKGREVIEAVPADRSQVIFRPAFKVKKQSNGLPNFLGPFAQGRAEERFFYLSWGTMDKNGSFAMFRRAKIHLNHLKWSDITEAISRRVPLRVVLRLTDSKGGPLCASVRDDRADWQPPASAS